IIIDVTTCLFAQQRFNFSFNSSQPDLLVASAGDELQITGSEITLGGDPAAAGGLTPYSYQWLPEENLNDPTLPNPICSVTSFAEYVLTVIDSRGCFSSDSVQLLITSSAEINTSLNSLLLFPNPAQGQISIAAPKTFNYSLTTITVFDQTGKAVISQPWEGSYERMGLDISKLSTGKYIVQLKDALHSVSSPMIIK
ncbi:MAG: T9SS type A sorting domain-containing protein, partial [Bacteroidia bacterium]